MKLDLTADEAQILVNLINVAVQAKGIEAAEAALHFVKKIKTAQDEAAAPKRKRGK